MIEIAAQMVAQDNAELATVFLQKTAIERALPEIDKRLATVSALSISVSTSSISISCA